MDCYYSDIQNIGSELQPQYAYGSLYCDTPELPGVVAGFTFGEIVISYFLFVILVIVVAKILFAKWI